MNRITLCIFCLLITTTAFADQALKDISITLPPDNISGKWEKAFDKTEGEAYLREWIPVGTTFESTDWVITVRRTQLPRVISADIVVASSLAIFEKGCTSTKYNGPETIQDKEFVAVWFRVMCAQQIGKPYGSMNEQLIVVDGTQIFSVTSEIRHPPSDGAGNVSFPEAEDQKAAVTHFLAKSVSASLMVRENVKYCLQAESGC